jgi:hypothetical protein
LPPAGGGHGDHARRAPATSWTTSSPSSSRA